MKNGRIFRKEKMRFCIYVLKIFTSLLWISDATAKSAAELSYQLWYDNCAEVSAYSKSTNVTKNSIACLNVGDPNVRIKLMHHRFGEIGEEAFLAALAEQRIEQLSCAKTQLQFLEGDPKSESEFIDDYAAKLELLNFERRTMQELRNKKPFTPEDSNLYDAAKMRATAFNAALPFSQIDAFQKVIEYSANQNDKLSLDHLGEAHRNQIKSFLKGAIKKSKSSIEYNQAIMAEGVNSLGRSLTTGARESLAQDIPLVESVRHAQGIVASSIQDLACHVDAKYGRGASSRDTMLVALSVFGPGVAAGLAKAGAMGIASSISAASAAGAISVRSAGIMRILASAGAAGISVQQINQSCFAGAVTLTGNYKGRSGGQQCDENILRSQKRENCALVLGMTALGVAGNAAPTKNAWAQLSKDPMGALNRPVKWTPAKVADFSDSAEFRRNPQVAIWELSERGQPEAAAELTKAMQNKMRTLRIVKAEALGNTWGRPKLVELADGTQGIWKAHEPWGLNRLGYKSVINDGDAEVGVFDVAQKIRFNAVPITVDRSLDGVKGSLQLFVKNDNVDLQANPGTLLWFDDLVFNIDRNNRNYLSVKGRTVAIDHGLALADPPIDQISTQLKFPQEVRSLLSPFRSQTRVIADLEEKLADAASAYGMTSTKYRSLQKQIEPQIVLQKKLRDEARILAKNQLSVLLPEREVYQNLKSTTAVEWNQLLENRWSKDRINRFINNRDEVVKAIDEVEGTFGKEIFRDGPISALNRQRALVPTSTAQDILRAQNADKLAERPLRIERPRRPAVKPQDRDSNSNAETIGPGF